MQQANDARISVDVRSVLPWSLGRYQRSARSSLGRALLSHVRPPWDEDERWLERDTEVLEEQGDTVGEALREGGWSVGDTCNPDRFLVTLRATTALFRGFGA